MPTITGLVQGKKNPNRVNVYLDGLFAFALSIDEVGKRELKKGLELTDIQIEEMLTKDINDKAYGKVLNFISYRPRTLKEIRDRLKQYEVDDKETQNYIIDRLTANGYIDDVAFARWFVESRNIHRPRSHRMLTQELMIKGVSKEDITLAMDSANGEETSILKVLNKKLGEHRHLESVERQNILGYLGRQGYSWELIKEVVKSWESE